MGSTPRSTVVLGEALAVLATLADGTVDAVITDPPYSSGGAYRSDRMAPAREKYQASSILAPRADFTGDNRDQRAYGYWCALWLSECLRVAKPGAPLVVFTDWRQLPTTTDAIQAGGWIWRGIVPWNKTEGARKQRGRFTSQCEFAVWGSSGPMPEERGVGCLPGFISAFPNPREKHHIAGKPIEVMLELVEICEAGGLILDPFCGSGSTGVAALRTGRSFLGVEQIEEHANTARARLEAEAAGLSLEAHRGGQLALGTT
jgi:site-specific DNA-methyltransferase (adenine-specific)